MSDAYVDLKTGRWVLFAAILSSSMAFIDGSALNLALPAIQRELGASGTDLLWIMNGYLLFLSALIMVGGSLGDIYGRKRVLSIGISVFAVASIACGSAPTTGFLIFWRAVQGVGGALMVPGSLALITGSFAPDARGGAIGTWSALSTVTTLAGPVIGGVLAEAGLWRAVFFINVPIALLALGGLMMRVPECQEFDPKARIDWGGTLFITLGLAGLAYGFIEAPTYGLSSPWIAGALAIGVISLITFLWVESRHRQPMVPLSLFKSSTFSGANLLTLFLYAALNAALFFFSLNLIQAQGYPEGIAGLTMIPFTILLTLLSRWAGRLSDRRGPRLPLTIGPAIVSLGFLLLALPALTAGPSAYWTTFFPGIAAVGAGMGITVAPLSNAVMGSVARSRAGVASGINNAVARTAGVLAIAIVGALVLTTFSARLQTRIAAIDLPPGVQAEINAQASLLAAARPPSDLEPSLAMEAEHAIQLAFVDAFRLQALLAAGLAVVSAGLAFFMIEDEPNAAETKSDAAL